jgi:hypothetical protein
MPHRSCSSCAYEIPRSAERCPHCGRPGLYPNVDFASEEAEIAALEDRYRAARRALADRGLAQATEACETALGASRAVIARSLGEVQRLASSDKQGYATYYQLIEAEARFPDGDDWDLLRRLADEMLFPGCKEHIRFAALTLDGSSLPHYGNCSMVLRTSMIEHRASLFEENSAAFVNRYSGRVGEAVLALRGRRATWAARVKLCIAKLVDVIRDDLKQHELSALLLSPGKTSADDRFVEVHIWGPITIRTIGSVHVDRLQGPASKVILKNLKQLLAKVGDVLLEQRSHR